MARAGLLAIRTVLVISFWAQSCFAGDFGDDNLVLTDDTIESHVHSGTWIVDFYAPWCGHCKKLIPEWATLATNIRDVAKAGSVDATSHKTCVDKYNVKGYPSIKLFLNEGKQRIVDYKGGRNAKDLEAFVRKMLKPAVQTLNTNEEYDGFIKQHDVAFVMVPGKSDALEFDAAYNNVSEHWQAEVNFGRASTAISSKVVAQLQHASADLPGVAAFSDGEFRESLPIRGAKSSMATFVEDNHIPLVPELAMGSFYRITHSGRRTVVGVLDPYNDARTKDVKMELREMAKATKSYRFGWIDGVKWPEFLSQIGISAADFPILMIIDAPKKIHYVHRNTTYGRAQFIKEVEAGAVPAEGEGASWISWITPGPTGAAVIVGVVLVVMTFAFSV